MTEIDSTIRHRPSELIGFGRAQWQRKWRVFAQQWSQPQLMKLAAEILDENALHSSQIHGFSTGKLRDPAPKVLMVIGLLNLALAQANGEDVESDYRCPMARPELWRDKNWLRNQDGTPMGPSDIFLAITGLVDHRTEEVAINEDNVEDVCKCAGKFLRKRFAELEIDWLDTDWGDNQDVMQPLLYGQVVAPAVLIDRLDSITELAKTSVEELVELCVTPYPAK